MFDLHVHTCYSPDGYEKPEDIAKFLKRKGFKGMAIVDHHTVKGAVKAFREIKDFVIIPGVEINTAEGHILGFGIMEDIKSREAEEVVEEIRERGGIAVLAHPFRFSKPKIKTDAVEALNGRNFPVQNARGMEYVKKNGVPFTAGSDGHRLWEMGSAYAIMDTESMEDAIEAIMKRKVEVACNASFFHPIKCRFYSFLSYVERGFKRV